jgi:hypothetical protein
MNPRLRLPVPAWGIVERTGKLAVIDGHLPVFWRRHVAVDAANNAGYTTRGTDADVVIQKVMIRRVPETTGGEK